VNTRVTARIAEVVQKANGVRDSLAHIVDKAREVDSVVAQITDASKEQSSGLEQINRAINQMNQVTQANAAGSEQTASASEELTVQASELRSGVDALVKLVKGRSFTENTPVQPSKVGDSSRRQDRLPVQSLDLRRRKTFPLSSVGTNGNGHNGNGNGHDEFFFDM
jgi:uncharacterized phage infection (PIP) family protein YhgE